MSLVFDLNYIFFIFTFYILFIIAMCLPQRRFSKQGVTEEFSLEVYLILILFSIYSGLNIHCGCILLSEPRSHVWIKGLREHKKYLALSAPIRRDNCLPPKLIIWWFPKLKEDSDLGLPNKITIYYDVYLGNLWRDILYLTITHIS